MTTAYTSLLGLALPVTGELSGTWGDTVNDYITQYLDASVAGTQTISGSQTAVTLSKTTNASLSQAGSGATGSSQYNVINCTGNPASMLTVTVPAASKTYVVVNATSTNQDVKIVGAGPTTGVTLVAGEKAVIAWNGSDFIKVATSAVDGVSTISFGTTGLTPSSATSGAVTVAGTLVAANGGTGQSSYTTGDLLYATGSTALSKLGIGTNGQILTSTGTAPQWSTLSGVAVTTFSAGTTGFTPSSATSGAVTLAGTLATTNGGTGLTSFTANGVVYASSTSALTTGSALSFDGTTLTTSSFITSADVSGLTTLGRFSSGYAWSLIRPSTTATGIEFRTFAGDALYQLDQSSGANKHIWYTGGSEQMRLTSTGLGIGTSSPSTKLHVTGSVANGAVTYLNNTDTANGNGLFIRAGGSNAGKYALAVENAAASSLLVLEASGNLGIGTSSNRNSTKLDVRGNISFGANASYYGQIGYDAGVGALDITSGDGAFRFIRQSGLVTSATLDSSGNLGLGVTPSAWVSSGKALQVGNSAGLLSSTALEATVTNNCYLNSGATAWIYLNTAQASRYQQYQGVHSWFTAGSGTAGTNISFTQAMTLDAGGNLGVGTTSPPFGSRIAISGGALNFTETAARDILWGTSSYVYITGNQGSGTLAIGTASTERFRIGPDGQIGLSGANYGTSGQVLTSNGSGSAPTWQTVGGGSAATPTALGTVYGKTDLGSPYSSFLGYQAGNSTTASSNVGVGYQSVYTNSTGTGNAALGVYSLFSNTTGNYNTAVGSGVQGSVFGPLHNNTTGSNNIAVGTGALYANTTASENTAVGYQASYSGTTGTGNTSVGMLALQQTTTASYNTGLGWYALQSNTTGADNTAVGAGANYLNTTGSYNTAVGKQALRSNTTGTYNIANGYQALYSNTTAPHNSAVGSFALYGATTGGYNTAVGYNAGAGVTTNTENTFLGYQSGNSGNGQGVVGIGYFAGRGGGSFSVWVGYNAGQSTSNSGTYNVGMGFYAGVSNTSGQSNVFIGYQAGQANTTGTNNVFIGGEAGNATGAGHANTTGSTNVAVGASALKSNTTGGKNTAVGYQALYSAATTRFTAIGYQALYSWNGTLTTDAWNTAVGENVLRSATTGICNVAVGCSYYGDNTSALHDLTTGNYCTAMGAGTMKSVTTGSGNTGFGYNTTYYLTTGNYNTSVGYAAGSGWGGTYLTTGNYNTYVGFGSNPSSSSVQSELMVCSSSTYALNGKGSNTGFIAAYNGSYGGIYQGNNSSSWSTTSDRRLKKNIVDNNEGIEVISQIRVRNFEYRLPEEVDPELSPKTAVDIKGVQLGVIAQELQQVCPDCVKEESTGVLSVDSDNVFWHMVNAIKQLKTELDTVKAELATLKGA